jgi:transcriptional regulator with XRE-family HTH domain
MNAEPNLDVIFDYSQHQTQPEPIKAPHVVSRDKEIATDRLRLLAEQVAAELGVSLEDHGAQSEVCLRLGITTTTYSHIKAGRRNVGLETIGRVVAHMGIDRAFFFDEAPARPQYRDYLSRAESRVEKTEADTPGWRQFVSLNLVERYRELGLDEAQLEYVRHAKFHRGAPTDAAPYVRVAEALLDRPVTKSADEALRDARARRRKKK